LVRVSRRIGPRRVEKVEHKDRDVEVEEQEVITEDEVVVGVSRVVRWVREEHPHRKESDGLRSSGSSYSSSACSVYIGIVCSSAF
jgi:DNA gyrase/topoisomerase IV subunit A